MPLYLKKHRVGKVHSKFNQGLNVQFDDFLLYVGCTGTPLSVLGLNVDEGQIKNILNSVKSEDMVVNKGNRLLFYSVDGVIVIDYKDLEEIDLRLPKVKCTIKELVDTKLYKYLTNMDLAKNIGLYLDERTRKQVELLLYSDKTDMKLNSTIIKFFVGRGKGLTPSGDDILLGFTLALLSFDHYWEWQQVLAAEVTKERTTLVSVAYLNALLQGYVSEYFIKLVELLDDAASAEIEKTVKAVQSFGHTSGNDTLFGFFLGLKFLIHQLPVLPCKK